MMSQDNPYTVLPSQKEDMERGLELSKQEYANRREKYDLFIADWLPRLPRENGEGKEIIRLLERLRKDKQ
jgi:hypothetical protein